jgi:acyl-[acyl carrier protein]--UDP-N-acetylglucosamine O-acyltransferase
VSGLTGFTQFTRVGAYSFMAAGAFANKDIVPYAIAEGHVLFLIFEPDGLAHRWRQIKAYWKLYPFSH